MESSNIFLGLGSNIGDKLNFLKQAVYLISKSGTCSIVKTSSVYESLPYDNLPQDNYFNAVININSELCPEDLFRHVKNIEQRIGRKKSVEKWAPREIDIDILFYNQLIYNSDELKIPHRELLKRDFVVVPLIEIAADFIHPILGVKLSDINKTDIKINIIRKTDYSIL